jgi:hypothetical protein
MITILNAGLAGIVACTLLAATAAAGDGKEKHGEAARSDAVAGALERAMVADVDAELAAIAARKCAGEKARCETSGHCDLACDCAPPAELLAYHLQMHPAAWEVVTPLLRERLQDTQTRGRVLDVLADAGRLAPAQELALDVLAKDADAFSRDQLIAFGDAGVEPMRAEIAKRAKGDVRLAAALVLQTGDQGKAHAKRLAKAAKHAVGDDASLLDAYASAAALKRLGDDEHWSALQARIEDQVLGALDDGAIERARDLALGVEFCVKNLGGAKAYGLGYLESRLAFHRAVRSGEAADADRVFELIETVASR